MTDEHYTEAQLVAAGGNLWEGHNARRVYFNRLERLLGLEVRMSGPAHLGLNREITHATLDGENVSTRTARSLLEEIDGGRLWYDLDHGRFRWNHELPNQHAEAMLAELRIKIRRAAT